MERLVISFVWGGDQVYKINNFAAVNLGKIANLDNVGCSNINVFLGENSTGKTFLLKVLYAAVKAQEDFRRGEDKRSVADILSDKLRWTFQVERIGDLVTRSVKEPLNFSMQLNSCEFEFQFSRDASSRIINISDGISKEGNSIFIPAKEVLSLYSIILKSREIDKSFGFDDTYYDLAKALRISPSRGKNYSVFASARKKVKNIIDGKVDLDEGSSKWYYKNNKNQKFAIGATSEGIKKLSILDRLFANGYLTKDSIVFIDELEAALHPRAICDFLDMIYAISERMDIQFFITTHSYFVIKKLYLIAMKRKGLVTCVALQEDGNHFIGDLNNGMPENAIVDVSIELYKQEIDEVL